MPLVNTFPPYEGELLLSELYRLSHLNYNDPRHILPAYIQSDILNQKRIDDKVDNPTKSATFEILEELTQLDKTVLWQSTTHSFAATLTPPEHAVVNISLGRQTYLLLRAKERVNHLYHYGNVPYCPLCLREARYFRKGWLLVVATFCLEHNCLLQKNCPKCDNFVTVHDVTFDECHTCGFRLSTADCSSFIRHSFEIFGQQLIQSWFQLCNPPHSILYEPIPKSSSASLYSFLSQVVNTLASLNNYQNHRTRKNTISIADQHRLGVQACGALINWPLGFYELLIYLRGELESAGKYTNSGFISSFGLLFRWLQQTSKINEYKFAQEAFDEFVADEYGQYYGIRKSSRVLARPTIIQHFAFITYSEATKILKLSTTAIDRFIKVGVLSNYPSKDVHKETKRPHFLLKRTEVLDLCAKLESSLSSEEASNVLGISRAVLRKLIDLGVISALRGPSIDESQIWSIEHVSVLEFLGKLTASVVVISDTDVSRDSNGIYIEDKRPQYRMGKSRLHLIDTTVAVKKLSTVGKDLALLILHVNNSKLKFYSYSLTPKINELFFSEDEINVLIEQTKRENGWVDRYQIAREMEVKVTVVSRWIKNGLLQPVVQFGSATYFSKEKMKLFKLEYIFTSEVSNMLVISQLTVQKWARKGRLKPVAGHHIDGGHRYVFRRTEVEYVGRCLSSSNIIAALKIRLSTLDKWVQEGKLTPVSGRGVDKCTDDLFDPDDIIRMFPEAKQIIKDIIEPKMHWFEVCRSVATFIIENGG